MDLQLMGVLLALLFSAWFAGAETTFLSFNKARFQAKLHSGTKGAWAVDFLNRNPERFLITTLTGNNLSNVIYSSLIALWFTKYGISEEFIFIAAPLIVLIFGEAIPKVIARQLADRLILIVGILLFSVRILLWPIVRLVELVISAIQKRLNIPVQAVGAVLSRMEITSELTKAGQDGLLTDNSVLMLRRLFNISERRVRNIMTPRISVIAIPDDTSISEARRIILDSGFSRLPCYSESIDNLTGVVIANDLLEDPSDLKSVLRPLHFVPESLPVIELAPWMKKRHIILAGVIDEFGGFAGIVSIDDIAQELVGVIRDEYDSSDRDCIRLSQKVWLAAGRTNFRFLTEKTGIKPFGKRATSLSGVLTQIDGNIPKVGDEFDLQNANFRIIKADPRGVDLVKITIRDRDRDEGES